nr:MAG TPA: hypothetical protein [Caudoviricetes sp.]
MNLQQIRVQVGAKSVVENNSKITASKNILCLF